MKKLLGILVLLIFSCRQESPAQKHVSNKAYDAKLERLLSHSVSEIEVEELKKYFSDYTLLDAREKEEYSVSHIPGAVYIGYNDVDLLVITQTPKNEAIVVYCSVGYRSEKITEKLEKSGFTNVRNLYGGIFEWKNSGGTLENAKGETDKIHAYDKTWGKWLLKGEKVY